MEVYIQHVKCPKTIPPNYIYQGYNKDLYYSIPWCVPRHKAGIFGLCLLYLHLGPQLGVQV